MNCPFNSVTPVISEASFGDLMRLLYISGHHLDWNTETISIGNMTGRRCDIGAHVAGLLFRQRWELDMNGRRTRNVMLASVFETHDVKYVQKLVPDSSTSWKILLESTKSVDDLVKAVPPCREQNNPFYSLKNNFINLFGLGEIVKKLGKKNIVISRTTTMGDQDSPYAEFFDQAEKQIKHKLTLLYGEVGWKDRWEVALNGVPFYVSTRDVMRSQNAKHIADILDITNKTTIDLLAAQLSLKYDCFTRRDISSFTYLTVLPQTIGWDNGRPIAVDISDPLSQSGTLTKAMKQDIYKRWDYRPWGFEQQKDRDYARWSSMLLADRLFGPEWSTNPTDQQETKTYKERTQYQFPNQYQIEWHHINTREKCDKYSMKPHMAEWIVPLFRHDHARIKNMDIGEQFEFFEDMQFQSHTTLAVMAKEIINAASKFESATSNRRVSDMKKQLKKWL